MHKCNYCQRDFLRESSLLNHACKQKSRVLAREERAVQIGLQAYKSVMEREQGGSKTKTWEDFESSQFYTAMVKFGNYVININAVAPEAYLRYLVKNNKKIDRDWCSDKTYDQYLLEYLRREPAKDAVARSIETMAAQEGLAEYAGYFRYVNENKICHAIAKGKISPWAVYLSSSGDQFLSKLNQDQQRIVEPYLEREFWARKFNDFPADAAWCADLLSKAGL